MSIASQIDRISALKGRIRTKLVALGFLSQSVADTASLSDCTTAIEGITAQSAVVDALTVDHTSATIPAGLYASAGTVSFSGESRTFTANGTYVPTSGKLMTSVTVNVSGSPSLQTKTVTPSTSSQLVEPDAPNYVGLSSVTVEAIPSNYTDVSGTTATAAGVLSTMKFYDSSGVETTGTMANNTSESITLDKTTTSYTIPAGYHNGSGTVSVDARAVTINGNGTTTAPEGVLYKQVTTAATVTTGVQDHTVTHTIAADTVSANLYTGDLSAAYPNLNIVGVQYVKISNAYRHLLRLSSSGSDLVVYDPSTHKIRYRVRNTSASDASSFTITFGLLYVGVSTI